MNRFGHLAQVRTLFEAGRRVGINTVRALNRMCDRQADQGLLARTQLPFGKNRSVVIEEFLCKFGGVLADIGKVFQIFAFVVVAQ